MDSQPDSLLYIFLSLLPFFSISDTHNLRKGLDGEERNKVQRIKAKNGIIAQGNIINQQQKER
jgi:hypothetical protein